jgi:NTE family protein
VYRALEEAGVPIDFVSGTSIGAAMAAWISWGLPAQALIDKARKAFAGNPTGDINFPPLISLVKGRRLKKTIDSAIADTAGSDADVADSWKTLICIATNFSRASEMVIERGPLARAIRASVSIPVALPPVPWEGDLLVDGGVLNNFPTDVLERKGVRRIIGVDLTRSKSRIYEHDEIPGTWRLLWDRLRGRRRYRLPGLSSILMNTTILYSESRREEARQAVDLYFNPEFGRIGLLEWSAFDRLVEIGYQHAREVLSKMTEEELAAYRGT